MTSLTTPSTMTSLTTPSTMTSLTTPSTMTSLTTPSTMTSLTTQSTMTSLTTPSTMTSKLQAVCLVVILCVMAEIRFTDCHTERERIPKLLLISFDGFRWDYMNRFDPTEIPNFIKFRSEGVYAVEGIKNVFMTTTFPNHFSIVTGLYEESHGIVGGIMYDPVFNETFVYKDLRETTQGKWFSGEPIWVTNQEHSEGRRSGVIFWPCSDAPIKGRLPSTYMIYDESIPELVKIDTLINWFTDKDPINLGLLYIFQPDRFGHKFGPDSNEVHEEIKKLDALFGSLLSKLHAAGLLETLDIIVTSDHGMTNTPVEKTIYLDNHSDPHLYTIVNSDTTVAIIPKHGQLERVYEQLRNVPHSTVYKKGDIPEEYHYKHNRRITPLLLVADLGYTLKPGNATWHNAGSHGYNNSLPDMHPMFMARGPSFKQKHSIRTFDSVDIYEIMCLILNLTPAPNNGSLDRVRPLLGSHVGVKGGITIMYLLVIPLCLTLCGVFCVAACCLSRISRRPAGSFTNGLRVSSFTKLTGGETIASDSEEEFP